MFRCVNAALVLFIAEIGRNIWLNMDSSVKSTGVRVASYNYYTTISSVILELYYEQKQTETAGLPRTPTTFTPQTV